MRFFNTAGPVNPRDHYCLPPLERLDLLAEGLAQTWEYLDRGGAAEGHLVIFDRAPDRPWAEKLYRREETVRGRPVTVWGM